MRYTLCAHCNIDNRVDQHWFQYGSRSRVLMIKNDKATDISKIQKGDISKGVAHKLEFYDFSQAFSFLQKEARMILKGLSHEISKILTKICRTWSN